MKNKLDGHRELEKIEQLLQSNGLLGSRLEISMSVLRQLQVALYNFRSDINPFVSVDRSHQYRPENGDYDGRIPECNVARCSFECCDVGLSGTNTIKMPMREVENAKFPIDHLTIVEGPDEKGCRVTCNNGCNNSFGCGPDPKRDGKIGYKPYDCDDYPWFRNLNQGKIELWIADPKCPLPATAKLTHLPGVLNHFLWHLDSDSRIRASYENAIQDMVGYKKFDPIDLEKLEPQDFRIIFDSDVQLSINNEKENLKALNLSISKSDIQKYEDELRWKTSQALAIIQERDGIKYSHLYFY